MTFASEAIANEANEASVSGASEQVDALVVIGATPKAQGLEGLSELVTKDVYDNLKVGTVCVVLLEISCKQT